MARKFTIIILLLIMLFTSTVLYFAKILLVSFHLLLLIIIGSVVLVILNTLEIGEVRKKEAEKLLKLGEDLYNRNELQNARKALEKALKLQPDNYEAYLGIAQCHRMKLETAEALEQYKKAIDVNPDRHEAHFFMGMTYFQANRPEEALTSLKKAESLKPDLEDLQYLLGEIHEKLEKYEEAKSYYEKYLNCCVGCRMKASVLAKLAGYQKAQEEEKTQEASAEGESGEAAEPRPKPARKFVPLVEKASQPLMLNLKVEIGKRPEKVVTPSEVKAEDRKVVLNLSGDATDMDKIKEALEKKRKEKTGELQNN